jgi:hypothetical protein
LKLADSALKFAQGTAQQDDLTAGPDHALALRFVAL